MPKRDADRSGADLHRRHGGVQPDVPQRLGQMGRELLVASFAAVGLDAGPVGERIAGQHVSANSREVAEVTLPCQGSALVVLGDELEVPAGDARCRAEQIGFVEALGQ